MIISPDICTPVTRLPIRWKFCNFFSVFYRRIKRVKVAGAEGLEPPTVRFEAEYSIQLSYTPTQGAKDNSEPLTFLVMLFFEQMAKERAAII